MWKEDAIRKLRVCSSAQRESGRRVSGKMEETLQNELKFERFMNWMYREFNHEAALSFIEFIQFKQYMLNNLVDEEDGPNQGSNSMNLNVDLSRYINLSYASAPKSNIIFRDRPNMDELAKCQEIAHLLYIKYIREHSAEFEINIDGLLRAQYRKYENEHWEMRRDEMINVFDAAIKTMLYYMRQSFLRLTDTANEE